MTLQKCLDHFYQHKNFFHNKWEGFALEILEEKTICWCEQQVKITEIPSVFYSYSEESSELKTGNPELTMEMCFHEWTRFLHIAMMAYPSSIHRVKIYTPAYVVFYCRCL